MVKPPHCKICDAAHWLREPHTFSGPAPKPIEVAREAVAPTVPTAPAGFDKKAYQRELMRKRRAAAKGAKA